MYRDDQGLQAGIGTWLSRAGKAAAAMAGLAIAAVFLVTCDNQDPLAPEGSTITVSASPQTIPIIGGGAGNSTITATVRGKNGTRLPDQEVTFNTSQGTLDPPAQSPLITDDQGQATSTLITNSTATVTAFSGSISGNTTVNVVTGDLSNITVSLDVSTIQNCSDTVEVTASAADVNGDGVTGVVITFKTKVPNGFNELKGNFNPTQPRTDLNGEAVTTFTPDPVICSQKCSASAQPAPPNGGACAIDITAQDISGTFISPSVRIDENVQ